MLDAETDALYYLENAGMYLISFWTLEINQILTFFSLLSVPSSWPTSPHIPWKVQCICSETLPYPCWCLLYLQLLLLFYSFLLFINILVSSLKKKKVAHQPRLDAWDKCSGLVHWEDPEELVGRNQGGGIRMGNTCNSMADSCQCVAKPTAIL